MDCPTGHCLFVIQSQRYCGEYSSTAKFEKVRRVLTNMPLQGLPMPTYESSPLLNRETQVETTIELTNRVCDSVFHRSMKEMTDSATGSQKNCNWRKPEHQ